MKSFLLVAVFACALNAETAKVRAATPQSSIRVPMIGFAPMPSSGGLRPVWGTFGADILGDPMALPSGVNLIAAAPGQQYALSVRGDQGELGLVLLNEATGIGDFQTISGALANADHISFSPKGSSAILYASTTQRFEVLTGLPSAPRVARDVDGSLFVASVVALAVSDDAAVVLAGFSGDTPSITLLASDGTVQTVLNAASVAAIRFFPGTHDAVFTDRLSNQVTLLSGDSFSQRILASDAQGVSAPLDVETSIDGTRVYVANSGANDVLMIDVATGNSNALPSSFVPAAFGRLFRSVLSVTAQDGNDVWLLDTDASSPWVAYAPKMR
jgi:hypothetical protein